MNVKLIKKILLFSCAILIALILIVYSYSYIIGKAMQKIPYVALPQELKLLENEINVQAKNNDGGFEEIPKSDMEKCHIILKLKLYIDNDSIAENNINAYLKNISYRVNHTIKNKNCFDSLEISYSLHDKRDENGWLIFKKETFKIK